jgi:ACR3 family arsenite efflux pump ArsB
VSRVAIIGAAAIILLGYWKYTEPDPTVEGLENPAGARAVCRTATGCYAGITVVTTLLQVIALLGLLDVIQDDVAVGMAIIGGGLGLLGFVAWVVQVIASLKYTAWVAKRLPDPVMEAKARRYTWLLPLIAVLGLILLYLGPLIALVMYWNLLDKLRKRVRAIQAAVPPFPRPA